MPHTVAIHTLACWRSPLVLLSFTLIRAIQNWWMTSNILYAVILKHNLWYYACGLCESTSYMPVVSCHLHMNIFKFSRDWTLPHPCFSKYVYSLSHYLASSHWCCSFSTLMTSCSTSTHPKQLLRTPTNTLLHTLPPHTVSKSSSSQFLPRVCTSISGIQMNNYMVLMVSWFLSPTYYLQTPQWRDVFKLSFLLVILHQQSWYYIYLSACEMVWFGPRKICVCGSCRPRNPLVIFRRTVISDL